MRRLFVLAIAAAAVTAPLSGPVSADSDPEHTIVIVGGEFFPWINYVKVGEKIRFYNADGYSRRPRADNYQWDMGWIEPGQSKTITVYDGMRDAFRRHNNEYDTGRISFKDNPAYSP